MKKIIILLISFFIFWINTAFTTYQENDQLVNDFTNLANLETFTFTDNLYSNPYKKNRNNIQNLVTNQITNITHQHWTINSNCWYWSRSTIIESDNYFIFITDNYGKFSVETLNKNNLLSTIHCIDTGMTPSTSFWVYNNNIIIRISTNQYYLDLWILDWTAPLYWNPNFWKLIPINSNDHLPLYYFWFSNISQQHKLYYHQNTLIKYNTTQWQIEILQYDDPYLSNTISTNDSIIKENVVWHNIIRTFSSFILSLYLNDWTYQSFTINPDQLEFLDNYYYLKYSTLTNSLFDHFPRWTRIVNNYQNFWVSNRHKLTHIIPFLENNTLRRVYYTNQWALYINWSHIDWSFNQDETNDNPNVDENWWFLSNIANSISNWFNNITNIFKIDNENVLDSFISDNFNVLDSETLWSISTTWSWFLTIDSSNSQLNEVILKNWITWSTSCEIINKNTLTFVYYSNTITWINFSFKNITLTNNILWTILDKITWVFIWPLNTIISTVWIITPFTQNNTDYCLMWKVFTIEHHKYFKESEDYNQFTFLDYIVLMAFFFLIYKVIFKQPIENTSNTLDELKFRRKEQINESRTFSKRKYK